GQIGKDSGILRGIADSKTRALVGRHRADVLVLEGDPSRPQREEPDDAVDGGGLPGPVAAHQADRLLLTDRNGDSPENLGPAAVGVDALDPKHGWARRRRP